MHLSTFTSSSSGSDAEELPQKNEKLHDHAPSSLLLLPDEISLNCLARVPRRDYPSVSLVSTTLRRLIVSPEIYVERSLLRRTEHVLYVSLRSYATEKPSWYTLNLKPFGQEESGVVKKHTLVPVPTSFPSVPYWRMSIVAVGSEMYFLGGWVDGNFVSTAFVVDCPSYTCRSLHSMKHERGCAAAGIIDGKLYVIVEGNPQASNWVEAFDLTTQTWETVTTGLCNNVQLREKTFRSFVMYDKIYLMDRYGCFVYDPKERRLKKDLLLNRRWSVVSCVIDNKLYTFDWKDSYTIWEFNPVSRSWRRVKGLENVPGLIRGRSKMVNYGGRLGIFCNLERSSTKIWYTEIRLERRVRGAVWGTVLWSGLVLDSEEPSTIIQSLSVSF